MKIVELGKFYPPHYGGIETLLRSWSEGFVALGAEVDCYVANTQPRSKMERLQGVKVHRTPDAVLQAQLAAWDKVITAQSQEPFFAKVVESQKAWTKRVVAAQFDLEVDQKTAYDHFFKA